MKHEAKCPRAPRADDHELPTVLTFQCRLPMARWRTMMLASSTATAATSGGAGRPRRTHRRAERRSPQHDHTALAYDIGPAQ